MFRFAHWWFLFGILLLPFWFYSLRRLGPRLFARIKFSDTGRLKTLPSSLRLRMRSLPQLFRLIALCLLICGVARPQYGEKYEEAKGEGVDIVVALDTSWSMRSQDFEPNSRLEVAKEVVKNFIAKRPYDRIGLIVFSAVAFTQCPLTTDHRILLNFVDKVDFCRKEYDGTAIGNAIATAVQRLKDSKAKSKVIVLVTDGENNRGIDPVQASEIAKLFKVKLYPIGIYNPQGFLQPIDDIIFGKRYVVAPPRVDEAMMKQIAENTGGKYFRATDPKALENVFSEIDKLEKSKVEVKRYYRYAERFPYFLISGLIFILAEIFLSETVLRRIP